MKNIQKYKRKIKLCTSVLIINYVYRFGLVTGSNLHTGCNDWRDRSTDRLHR